MLINWLYSKEEFENAVAQKGKLVLIYAVRLAIEANLPDVT
jgi:hypothetical protein